MTAIGDLFRVQKRKVTIYSGDDALEEAVKSVRRPAVLHSGKSPRESLRSARNELSSDARYAPPYYWGAFVLIGE